MKKIFYIYEDFVGKQNSIIPANITAYKKNLPNSNYLKLVKVKNARHQNGWDDKWENLLLIPPQC